MGDEELLGLLHHALAVQERVPPPERVAALRRQVAETGMSRRPAPRLAPARPVWWLAAAAAVLAAFGLGSLVVDLRPTRSTSAEFEAALEGPSGARAQVTGTKAGIGRLVSFRSNDLPILPKGEYYEVWFVGPGDRPGKPNRISAGTFHPDDQGRSAVDLTAAVDPAKYPELSVTAEPGDGDPAPNGPDVLRAVLQVR